MLTAAFVINLVQDVNILRPIAVIGARDYGFRPLLLVSAKFAARDSSGIWRAELELLANSLGVQVHVFQSEWEAAKLLGGSGILFAASESHLPNHVTVHDIFRVCPDSFLRVTIQHGFECVGYLHSAEHVKAHGRTASFGADYLCTWSENSLAAMAPTQRSKMIVTGPTAILQQPGDVLPGRSAPQGIICENLHSVRFRGPTERVSEFVTAFARFCDLMAPSKVALRPHPGGQYAIKNKVRLPENAYIENSPAYRLDFRQFDFGLSAPSSALIDMLLAGIPTAVWNDRSGEIDSGNYAGLTTVASPEEWAEFAAAAIADPSPFLERQQAFLDNSGIIVDPSVVHSRFGELFEAAARREVRAHGSQALRHRIQFVANGRLPTLQLSFEKPLKGPVDRGEVFADLLTEQEILEAGGQARWLADRLDRTQPSVLVFCRYSGPGWEAVVDWARERNVPVIYHIDDDLLAIPRDIGVRKHALHNSPERLETVASLLQAADLVYCSTEALKNRLLGYFPALNVIAGNIYCAGERLRPPAANDEIVVGYMASRDHAHNLQLVLPAVERLLEARSNVRFELFGSIPIPGSLGRFGDRVSTAPPVADYDRFLDEFASRQWDIGICPLAPIDFNLMKANTKWVEYSSAGVAVVASRGTVYDECCADGCGLLAEGVEEWFRALDMLATDSKLRCQQVLRSQARLEAEYGLERLREQVFGVIAAARDRANRRMRSEFLEKA